MLLPARVCFVFHSCRPFVQLPLGRGLHNLNHPFYAFRLVMFIINCCLTSSIFLAPKHQYSFSQGKTLEEPFGFWGVCLREISLELSKKPISVFWLVLKSLGEHLNCIGLWVFGKILCILKLLAHLTFFNPLWAPLLSLPSSMSLVHQFASSYFVLLCSGFKSSSVLNIIFQPSQFAVLLMYRSLSLPAN